MVSRMVCTFPVFVNENRTNSRVFAGAWAFIPALLLIYRINLSVSTVASVLTKIGILS